MPCARICVGACMTVAADRPSALSRMRGKSTSLRARPRATTAGQSRASEGAKATEAVEGASRVVDPAAVAAILADHPALCEGVEDPKVTKLTSTPPQRVVTRAARGASAAVAATVRVVVRQMPKLLPFSNHAVTMAAATRIQASARGMRARRLRPLCGYLVLHKRGPSVLHRCQRAHFFVLDPSSATLTWRCEPGLRPEGCVRVQGCTRPAAGKRTFAVTTAERPLRPLRLRATTTVSAEHWAAALDCASHSAVLRTAPGTGGDAVVSVGDTPASGDALAQGTDDDQGGGLPPPFVPSAVVPRLPAAGLVLRIVGRKDVAFALGRGQLTLHVLGPAFWKVLGTVVPAAGLRALRVTALPLGLVPDYLPASAFVAGTEAVDAELLLVAAGDRPSRRNLVAKLEALRAMGDPASSLC